MNQFWMLMLASIASVVTAADFAVADYGARADGMKCTAAFAKAMGEAAKAGGGRVVVPKGRWFTGPILLQGDHSNASFRNMILTKIVK